MTVAYLLTTFGLIPYFATRALLPLFLTALALRLGGGWSQLPRVLGVAPAVDLPSWATSDVSLGVLAVGAVVEAWFQRDSDLRELVGLGDAQFKTMLAIGVCLILAPEAGAHATPITLAWLGTATRRYAWALGIGWCVWWCAKNRARLFSWLSRVDAEDDFGALGLLSWVEEVVSVAGLLLVFLVPWLAAASALAAVLSSGWLARWASRHATPLVPCTVCREPVNPSGPHCPHCRAPRSPNALGLFGFPRPKAAHVDHQFRLLMNKRCRFCATRLKGNGVDLKCPLCGTKQFTSKLAVDAYLSRLGRRTLPLLVLLGAIGLVPLLGLFAGIVLYRLLLVTPVRQYTPTGARIVGRWLLRGANGVLLLLQPVPLLGSVVLPLMAMSNVWYYTRRMSEAAEQMLRDKDYSETLKR